MSDSSDEEVQKGDQKWDKNLEPLMKILMGKKGIEHREASEVDKKKVEYFRGRDFCEFMVKNDSLLKRRIQKVLDMHLDGNCPADDEDCAKIGSLLLKHGFIAKSYFKPAIETAKEKKKKWPDRLVRQSGNNFDREGYYIIIWEGSHAFRYLLLAGVITCIMAASLFSVWPIWARIAAWYVALAFCTAWFCLEVTRLSCFCLGWVVGVDFWILPNFNDEYAGILDSLKPIYSFERRKDGFLMLGSRVVVLVVVALAIEELSKTHSFSDFKDVIIDNYADIFEWGKGKAMMLEGPTEKAALPSVDQLEKELEELNEAAGVGGSGSTTGSTTNTGSTAKSSDDVVNDQDDEGSHFEEEV